MKEKKLQVFVSSTFTDLKDERQAAVEAILSSGHIPAGMELFSAGDESQMNVIKRWIDESDIYLLILGGRYGSIENNSGKSYTHLEYEYALSLKKPLFSVVISEPALEAKIKAQGSSVIEKDNSREYKSFKEQVLKNLVKFWDDKKDIKIAIHETLSEFNFRKDLIGWIRGNNAVNTGALAEEIVRLTKENFELRELMSNKKGTNSKSLYSNLTFEEMAELLNSQKTQDGGEEMSLLKYLLLHGSKLTELTDRLNIDAFEKLLTCKIIKFENIGLSKTVRMYKFT